MEGELLDTALFYSTLPIDLSGSRSKNRFRIELLWGVCKMLDLLALGKDFAMVFDYACDIEVHYSDGFEFYQIKTHGKTVSSYTSGQLVKKATLNAEGSMKQRSRSWNQSAKGKGSSPKWKRSFLHMAHRRGISIAVENSAT